MSLAIQSQRSKRDVAKYKLPFLAGLTGALVFGLGAGIASPALAQTRPSTPFTSFHESTIPGTGLNSGTWYAHVNAGEQIKINLQVPDDKYSSTHKSAFKSSSPVTVTVTKPDGTTQVKKAWKEGANGSVTQLGYSSGDWAGVSADEAGVWKVTIEKGEAESSANWNDQARLKWQFDVRQADGTAIEASRFFTESLDIGQTRKTGGQNFGYDFWNQPGWQGDAAQTEAAKNLTFHTINEFGQRYRVSIPNANGVNSYYAMNNLGMIETQAATGGKNTQLNKDAAGNCVSVPLSVPSRNEQNTETLTGAGKYGGHGAGSFAKVGDLVYQTTNQYVVDGRPGTDENQCANMSGYLIFAGSIDTNLPDSYSGTNWSGPINPGATAPAVSDLSFDRATGEVAAKVSGQPVKVRVKLGVRSSGGGFDPAYPPVTREVSLRPGELVQTVLAWDLTDANGSEIPATSDVRITMDGAWAPIHVIRSDMEDSRGGIAVSPISSDGSAGVRLNLHWDDTYLGDTVHTGGSPDGNYDQPTGPKFSDGLSLDGSAHAWATVRPAAEPLDGWGNKRAINDWALIPFAAALDVAGEEPLPEPTILVSKNAPGDDSTTVSAGNHEVVVSLTNTGEEALTGLKFFDTTQSGSDVDWAQADITALESRTLAIGETVTLRGSVAVAAGQTHKDSVRIKATGVVTGITVQDEDPTTLVALADVPIELEQPGIDVAKNAEGEDSASVAVGSHEVIVTLRNTGTEALHALQFTDTTESGNETVWNQEDLDALSEMTLEVGAVATIRGTVSVGYGVTHRDIAQITATGVISGEKVVDEDPTQFVPLTEQPSIDVSKNAEGDDSTTVEAGDHEVMVTLHNTGSEALTGLTFSDTTESGSEVTWNQDDLNALSESELSAGGTIRVRGTVSVAVGSTHRDIVSVTGSGVISGTVVQDEDPTELVAPPAPPATAIDVAKNAKGDDSQKVAAGSHEIAVTITNTGEEGLQEIVFADTTESGNDAVWNEDDLKALTDLVLEPGASVAVRGTVRVDADAAHRDYVAVSGLGSLTGTPVSDADPTQLEVKPAGAVTPSASPKHADTVKLAQTGSDSFSILTPVIAGITALIGAALFAVRYRKNRH